MIELINKGDKKMSIETKEVVEENQSDISDKERIEQEIASILSEVEKTVKIVGTLQERLHNKVLIPGIIHAWKYKDANLVKQILNGLLPVKASVRVESIGYYFKEVAGFDVKFDEKTSLFTVKFNKDKEYISPVFDDKFTYDVHHLNLCKDPLYRYWKIAPVKVVMPKLPDSLEKLFDNVEKTIAKALLVNQFEKEAISFYIENVLMKNAIDYTANQKIKDWADNFKEFNEASKE